MACGIKTWQGISNFAFFEIDHVDGNNKNNNLNNLRVLCGNCHAQTTTRYIQIKNIPTGNLSTENLITDISCFSNASGDLLKSYKARQRLSSVDKVKLKELLAGNHPTTRSSRIGDRLINTGIKEAKCESCGLTEHRGCDIRMWLEIHHKNHDPQDHKLDNLALLCPNCHTNQHVKEENTTQQDPVVFLSGNDNRLKRIYDLLNSTDRPSGMAACAESLNISYRVFKRLVLTHFPALWQADTTTMIKGYRKLDILDPVIRAQIKLVKETYAKNKNNVQRTQRELTDGPHQLPRKRVIALIKNYLDVDV
jgi:5-methylcytosine-specific restriction endonuclease McrA